MTNDELREKLATYAHDAWSGWMTYLFSLCEPGFAGCVVIPADKVERWQRQMNTPRAELPEHEQASDRAEADKMPAIFYGTTNDNLTRPLRLTRLNSYADSETLREAHNHLVDAINLLSERLYLLESELTQRDLRRLKLRRDRRQVDSP